MEKKFLSFDASFLRKCGLKISGCIFFIFLNNILISDIARLEYANCIWKNEYRMDVSLA